MSFFDSKQEVLNIELTQFGKFLLSRGKFKPAYYAFFDDDIVYDSNYINVTESQNYSQQRILNETPINKPLYNFKGVDSTAKQANELIVRDNIAGLEELEKEIKADGETNQKFLLPLGKSAYNSQYAPAWSINLIEGLIANTSPFLSGSGEYIQPNLRLPQLNMVTSSYLFNVVENVENLSEKEQVIGLVEKMDKTYYITGIDTSQIFDILENNVDDNKENFEIEVFIEEEDKLLNGQTKKNWKQLKFFKKPTNVQNNILLDEELYKETKEKQPNTSNVEYYFDLLVDDEIDLPPEVKTKVNIYGTSITDADKPFGEDC